MIDKNQSSYFYVSIKTTLVQTQFWTCGIQPDLNLSIVKKCNEDILCYCQNSTIEILHHDFNQRFEDILATNVPNLLLDPFTCTNTEQYLQILDKLIEVTINRELKL